MDQPQEEIQRQQQTMANYHFSPDEMRVLRECNTESFFQRSLPLGTSFGLAAYFGVKNGFIRPNVKYGAAPKIVVGVIVGYFVGKFSYQQKCAEKIMRLPNSQLGEMLRQRKQGGGISSLTPDQNLGRAMALGPFAPTQQDIYSDEGLRDNARSTSLNLDTESRPSFSGLDDTYRLTLDSPTGYLDQELPLESIKPGMSYEELRKKNREEYLKKQQSPYSRPLPPDAPVVIRQNEPPKQNDENERNVSGPKNKYGDTWSN